MKKTFVMILSMGLLITVGAALMVLNLRSKETRASSFETTQKGSAEAAKGLTITMKQSLFAGQWDYTQTPVAVKEEWSDCLWSSTFRYGENGFDGVTEVTKLTENDLLQRDAWIESENKKKEREGRRYYECGRHWDGKVTLEAALPEELLDRLDSSKLEETIRLADYLEYYPLINEIVAGGPVYDLRLTKNTKYWGYDEISHAASMGISLGLLENEVYADQVGEADLKEVRRRVTDINDRLMSFFRIPVLPDEKLVICSKGVKEEFDSYTKYERTINYSPDSDYYDPTVYTVCMDNAFLFTFDTRTHNGEIVDTSLIPGGYGVYVLPFTRREDDQHAPSVDLDGLRLFYPMDPKTKICDYVISPDGGKLYIVYTLDGKCHMAVVDTKTGEELANVFVKDIDLIGTDNVSSFGFAENDFYCATMVWSKDDGQKADCKTVVFAPDAAGAWDIAMLCEDEETSLLIMTDQTYFAFDGKRLVQVVPYGTFSDGLYSVCVITEEGTVYEGVINSSLPSAIFEYYGSDSSWRWNFEVSWE